MGVPPATAARTDSAVDRLAAAGRSPLLVVGEGAPGMTVGVVMLARPGETATVLALLFSVQLLTRRASWPRAAVPAPGGSPAGWCG